MKKLFNFLFGPKLPGKVEFDALPETNDPVLRPLTEMEHGIGKPKTAPYRDGIERYFAEQHGLL